MERSRLPYLERQRFTTNVLAQQLFALLDTKKTNLALSADVTDADALLALAEQLGPEICVLKTHVDILETFTFAFAEKLKALAKQLQFFIFEDRKFADIGNTVKNQYQGGVYRIVEWADMVNAHTLPGSGIIEGLSSVGLTKNRALLLLAEMSSANNLLTKEYADKTVQMAEQYTDFVIGFIAQRRLSADPRWIYLTPGVQLAPGKDVLGQQYVTPQQVITENQSDIIIVGRGILQASDPLQAAREYRAAGWEAYQASLLS